MKVIFLDFDGVLNGHEWLHIGGLRVAQKCVACLNQLVSVSGAELVISSTWRSAYNCGDVTLDGFEWMMATHGIVAPIRDLLPADINEPAARSRQINTWIKQYSPSAYVVLDDLPLSVQNLVRPNPAIGLEPYHVTAALQLLGAHSK